jgi:UDP-N-acetylglucosamine 2-epimerase (non-hydrolysing)
MKKIIIFVGTRPEAIKLAPFIKAIKNYKKIKAIICATGQHQKMVVDVLKLFSLSIDIRFKLSNKDDSLNEMSSKLFLIADQVLNKYEPDAIVVQGDTNTATFCALAASNMRIPIYHIEAGLRSGNINNPFPEERNRILISTLASFHLCPTIDNQNNLVKEGIKKSQIYVTGNTVIDAVNYFKNLWKIRSPNFKDELKSFLAKEKKILITCHRREMHGKNIELLCNMLIKISRKYPDFYWIFPVHPNPKIASVVYNKLNNFSNFLLTEPLNYETNLYVIDKVDFVVTDSGGIQEEALSFSKPTILIRDNTERPEAIASGFVKLASTNISKIHLLVLREMKLGLKRKKEGFSKNPFGDGKASLRISEIMNNIFFNEK